MANGRGATFKVRCEDCFFERNDLCAVTRTGPCPTFRPDNPAGLRPVPQLQLPFRHEREMRVAFVFPTPQELAARYAGSSAQYAGSAV
jgi:hypothetical protein